MHLPLTHRNSKGVLFESYGGIHPSAITSVLSHAHNTAETQSPLCILNRLISLLIWDLEVFDFIEGADIDQDVFAVVD